MEEEEKTSGTRYQEITRQLREELLAGRFGEEGRMPSEAQLVRKYGVSRPTAARALRKLVEEGLIQRRPGSGTFAKPGRGAPEHAPKAVLALLIPNLGNTEIFQMICGELASLARVHEYTLVWGTSAQPGSEDSLSLEQAEELCHQFIKRNVNGVFFAPYELMPEHGEANRRIVTALREAGIPLVLLDRDVVPFPNRSNFDLIGIDNLAGGYMIAEHLLKLGCCHLHFVSRDFAAPTVETRVAGVREAIIRRRIEPDRNWLHFGDPADKRFMRALLISPRPDALVCANDYTAAQLLQALAQNKIRVPEDVRVVGFDDVKFATLVSPPLTTVQQPCRQLALAAWRAMLNRQDDPTLPPCHFILTPRLIVRDSCGAYLPRRK